MAHTFVRKKLRKNQLSQQDDGEEFLNLDYTPCVNTKPIDFSNDLRCRRQGRPIKIICNITMYNEHASELKRTLLGLAENLDDLDAAGVSWHEMVVSIIVDGRYKASPSLLEYCENELKCYDKDLVKDTFRGQDVTMHIFERTVQLSKHTAQRTYYRPLQLIFALKERNGGKLNSHLWYFNAFCRQLVPKYTFLLDVGTHPQARALSKLYQSMEENPQVGGCCGEIAVRNPRVYNILEAAQHFEYKVSHVLDKAMEDVFGYISVLPGAFSAYRWEAITGSPLSQYFFVEENSVKEMGPFMANMYLAEDRVLCFELVAKRNSDWTLHYEAGAVADTDVPDNILELIKQRRRWLNGAFFSLAYYVSKFPRITKDSAHSWPRKFIFHIQFLYQLSSMVLNWFTVGSLYLSFAIVFFMAFESFPGVQEELHFVFNVAYFFLTILQFLVGLGGKANDTHRIYWVCSLIYGLIMSCAIVLSVWHLITNAFNIFVVFAAIIAFGSYAMGGFIHGELFAICSVALQYLFMLPTFVNMFTIYSFCNMHDISWGTKEGNLSNEQRRAKNNTIVQRLHAIAQAASGKTSATEKFMTALGANTAAAAVRNEVEQKDDLMDVAAMAAAAKAQAEADEAKAKLAQELAKERKQLEAEFASFRTRLVTCWIFSNWAYVTFITTFNYLRGYAIGVAGAILWTLAYRLTGSLLYVGYRAGKACCKCCCRCLAMYVCCCCCRNQDLKKRVRPRKNKYQLGDVDNGSHKLLHGTGYTRGPSRQRYSTGNPSSSPKWRDDDDDFGSVESIDNGVRSNTSRSRPNTSRSRPNTSRSRQHTSRKSTSRRPGSRAAAAPAEQPMVDLRGDLDAAANVSSTIMARKADGSRPVSNSGRRTARSTKRRGPRSRPGTGRTSVSGSGSDSDSSGSSSSGTDTSSDSDDGEVRGRAHTPGRTLSRPAMSNVPLTSRSRKPGRTLPSGNDAPLVPGVDLSAVSGGQSARRDSLSNLNL